MYKQVAGAVSIDIRGAKGPNAVTINGTYDPTDEVCNDWPVYQKRGDPNKWLEFFNQSNKWYIKATNDKGKARGWMRLSSDPTTTPENCKATPEVWDGSRWTSQPSVTIITAKQVWLSEHSYRSKPLHAVSFLLRHSYTTACLSCTHCSHQRIEEDQKAGSLRRLRATPVKINGATGPSGTSINGVYEPTGMCPTYSYSSASRLLLIEQPLL